VLVVKVSPCFKYRLLNGAPVQTSNGALDKRTSTGYPVVVVVVVVLLVVHGSQGPTTVIVAFGDVGTVILHTVIPRSGPTVCTFGNLSQQSVQYTSVGPTKLLTALN